LVDPSDDDIAAAVDAGVRIVQVHGMVPERRHSSRPPVILRAVHLAKNGTGAIEPPVEDDTVLLDAYDPVQRGGTGKTLDWHRAAIVARQRRVILAGGLTPENVRQAIAEVKPFAVDVASGVEASPGVKDHHKLRAFIAAAKEQM
jgi:phosphoribosylanthranilate isomerase